MTSLKTTASKMATGSLLEETGNDGDRISVLYPKVDESETPLPRSWSSKDKFSFIGLSQNNQRVHYKGKEINHVDFSMC